MGGIKNSKDLEQIIRNNSWREKGETRAKRRKEYHYYNEGEIKLTQKND